MPNDKPIADWTEAERQARALAALIDAAADDLAHNGPVPPAELQKRLDALEVEWAYGRPEKADVRKGGRRPG
jgi:hypothetical protein